MRTIHPGLQSDLDAGVQTLCFILKISTIGGEVFGYADQNIDLEYDDATGSGPVLFSAKRGFMPSDALAKAGLGVDNMEATALVPSFDIDLTPQRLAAGVLDDADFSVMLVNYLNLSPGRHVETLCGKVGRVWVVDGARCVIELRSLSSILRERSMCERDSLTCRVKRFGSQAGEERWPCHYNADPLWQEGVVSAAGVEPDRSFESESGIAPAFEPGPGMVRWITGDNAGAEVATESIEVDGGTVSISMVDPLPFDVQEGDEFEWRDDCDRSEGACQERGNYEWFRGEPKIKTSDGAASGMPGAQTSQGAGGADTTPVAPEFQQ